MIQKQALSLSLIVAAALTLGGFSVNADAQSSEQQNREIEEVVVTGSNIRRKRDFDTPSPIQTLGIEEIQAAGAGQVQDLLRLLPVNTGSEISVSQSDRQGTSQFNIRGLGVGGTLTLINGRRAGVSTSENGGVFYTDINQYPTNMIERIEILTDGASATYGSEAVGGVVNIITRSRFEGFEISGEYRDASNTASQLSLAFGSALDRGHFTTFFNYYAQDGNFRGDFDFLNERSNAEPLNTSSSFDSGTGAGRYNRALNTAGIYTRTGNTVADPSCGEANTIGVINTFEASNNCRYNFVDQRRLIAEEERFQIFSQFNYELTDSVGVFVELSYSNNEVRDAIGGAVLRTTTDNGGFLIPAAHPFNYFVENGDVLSYDVAAVTADPTQAVDVIFRGRPLTAFDGELADDITRQFSNTRAVLGFDFELSDRWSLNTSYMLASTKFTDFQPRSYNADAFKAAIASGNWNPFLIAATDPTAVSVKDGVSTAGNDLIDRALFSSTRVFVKESSQSVFDATFSGDVFSFNNGNIVSAAAGFQYRDFAYSDIPDSLSFFALDGRGDPVVTIDDSEQDVYAIFGEALIPVTTGLEVQLALRYEDYGDSGDDTIDPKIGVKYDIGNSGVQLRGSWGTSFRAPSIRQIEGSVNSGTLNDPGDALAAGDVCPVEGSGSIASNNAAQITLGGDLSPEDSTNYNLGIIFQSNFGLTTSVDFFNYVYKDLIQEGDSFQSIVSGECSTGSFVPDARVGRDAAGQLNNVSSNFINVGQVDANGLDLSLSYVIEQVLGGTLAFDAKATYVLAFDIDENGDGDTFDGAGNRNSFIGFGSIPDFRATLGATWSNHRHAASLFARHIGDYRDDSPGSKGQDIDEQTVIDIQYNISLDGLLGDGTTTGFTIGINNVFDEEPPEVASSSERNAYDNEVHDPRGRVVYVRAKYSF